MARRRRQDVYGRMMVKTYDMEFRNDVFTDQVVQRMEELVSNGVVQGYLNALEVYADGSDLKVKTGAAYINGERAYNGALATLAISEGTGRLVRAKYATAADVDAHATRLDDLGAPRTVWYTDSISLYTVDVESQADPTAINLAWASRVGGVVTVTDYREYASVKPPLKDASVATAKLANLAVTNAKIANKAVTTGKIADNTIGEGNMGASTSEVPLIQDIQVETGAGSSVNPAYAKINYAATMGGAYEYKIFGRTLRLAKAGPIRRLKLVATLETPGAGTGTVYLLAWLHGTEPGSYDPEDPGYDGLDDSVDMTGPDTDTIQLNLDISNLGTDPDELITYAVVLINNTTSTLHLHHVTLVGIR